jgi:16S rRNA (adenine1518-N6/adenine1519-N6)-dimethyltransferase
MTVRAKKHLGQHFLKDESVCQRMAAEIAKEKSFTKILEVGPGMGALTKYLLPLEDYETSVVEIDRESVAYLNEHYPDLTERIFDKDFLKIDLTDLMGTAPFAVVGNFPYNISSQILFKVIDFKEQIPYVLGMFQKELAERIAEKPGSKKYGIISVLLQAYYEIEYLFTVPPTVFNPPPKVDSGVIHLRRNEVTSLGCDESKFKMVVKLSFNQRRKTIRNSLKTILKDVVITDEKIIHFLTLRPEVLSVEDFILLTNAIFPRSN